MTRLLLSLFSVLFLSWCAGTEAEGTSGPPAPVPYVKIPDPPDDAERHIVVNAEDRGPVWLLTGFLGGWEPGITFDLLARVKTRHIRTEIWPFWSPVSISFSGPREGRKEWGDYRDSPEMLGQYLETMLHLRDTGMTWQLGLFHNGPFYGRMSITGEAALKDYYDHIHTIVKYARDMGLPADYWEVTNEPPSSQNTAGNVGGYAFRGTWEEYLAFWDTNYDAIRAAYPEAKIVGPSFGGSDSSEIEPFLAHCRDMGQRLDVLSWHNNCFRRGPNGSYRDEVDYVQKNINETRDLVTTKFPMVGVKEYHLDEWGYYLPQTGMGAQIAYFYYMDLAGLDRAAKTGPPYMMSATRISPDTPRAFYWAWVDYARQDGGVRLVTETNDRCFVGLASRHNDEKIVRAVVARAKRQAMADPAEAAPDWEWGDLPPAKPPVKAKIDFQGLPLSGQAEVTILRLPPGSGPLYEDDLDGITTTKIMDVADGKLSIELADVVEDNAFSIVIGPKGTHDKDKAEAARWVKAQPAPESAKSERGLHKEATQKAEAAAKEGVIRVNCGSALAYTDPEGHGWFADREYAEGGFGYVGGGTVHRGPIAIEGTDNPEIYRSELWGQKSYHITVPNGKYLVRLHWAETYGLGPGGRTFDVVVEGETVLKDFDATREAGGLKKAVVREFEVAVPDGVLDIEFPHKEDVTPMINAIEVIGN